MVMLMVIILIIIIVVVVMTNSHFGTAANTRSVVNSVAVLSS